MFGISLSQYILYIFAYKYTQGLVLVLVSILYDSRSAVIVILQSTKKY